MEKCIICEEAKQAGVHLYASFICTQCESIMIHTDVREEKYHYYVNKLKNVRPKLYL